MLCGPVILIALLSQLPGPALRTSLVWLAIWGIVPTALNLTLPLAMPIVATSALFAFLLGWDEFFYALLFTSDQRARTLTVAIADLAGGRVSDYGLIATAGVLAALPPVLVGLLMQRALISGLTSGGVKG